MDEQMRQLCELQKSTSEIKQRIVELRSDARAYAMAGVPVCAFILAAFAHGCSHLSDRYDRIHEKLAEVSRNPQPDPTITRDTTGAPP